MAIKYTNGDTNLEDVGFDKERTYQRSPLGTMPVGARVPAPWQHPQSAFGPRTSIMAPRLFQQNGQWTLAEHGNQRPLVGEEVGQAQGYVSDFWGKFPAGFQPGIGVQENAGYGVSPEQLAGFWPVGAAQGLLTGSATGGLPFGKPSRPGAAVRGALPMFRGGRRRNSGAVRPAGRTLGDLVLSGSSYADPLERL